MHKLMSFWTYSWFASTAICLVLEGSGFAVTSTHGTGTIINSLMAFTTSNASGFFGVLSATSDFIGGIFRLTLFDYSFYTGGWEIMRWFWVATLSPGLLWAIASFMMPLAAEVIRIF